MSDRRTAFYFFGMTMLGASTIALVLFGNRDLALGLALLSIMGYQVPASWGMRASKAQKDGLGSQTDPARGERT